MFKVTGPVEDYHKPPYNRLPQTSLHQTTTNLFTGTTKFSGPEPKTIYP
jgi:hypothetical protein